MDYSVFTVKFEQVFPNGSVYCLPYTNFSFRSKYFQLLILSRHKTVRKKLQ